MSYECRGHRISPLYVLCHSPNPEPIPVQLSLHKTSQKTSLGDADTTQ